MNANLKNKFQKVFVFFTIFTCEPVYLSSTEILPKVRALVLEQLLVS